MQTFLQLYTFIPFRQSTSENRPAIQPLVELFIFFYHCLQKQPFFLPQIVFYDKINLL